MEQIRADLVMVNQTHVVVVCGMVDRPSSWRHDVAEPFGQRNGVVKGRTHFAGPAAGPRDNIVRNVSHKRAVDGFRALDDARRASILSGRAVA